MRTYYAHSVINISGELPMEIMKEATIGALCQVIANQPKLKGRGRTTTTTHFEDNLAGDIADDGDDNDNGAIEDALKIESSKRSNVNQFSQRHHSDKSNLTGQNQLNLLFHHMLKDLILMLLLQIFSLLKKI